MLNEQFKIGLCQLAVTADKERNIVHARAAIEEAAEKGAKLVVLPVSSDINCSSDADVSFSMHRDIVMLCLIASIEPD